MLKKVVHGCNVVIYIYNKNKDTESERKGESEREGGRERDLIESCIVSENLLTTHPHGCSVPDTSQFHASFILLRTSTGRILKFIVFAKSPMV
jgi:hypothetical protein